MTESCLVATAPSQARPGKPRQVIRGSVGMKDRQLSQRNLRWRHGHIRNQILTLLSSGFGGMVSLRLNTPSGYQGLFVSVFGDGSEEQEDKSYQGMKGHGGRGDFRNQS